MRHAFTPPFLALLSFAALAACGKNESPPTETPLAPPDWTDAAGKFVGAGGEEIGHAVFADAVGGVLFRVRVKGLAPGWHGIHLHTVGDCSDAADGFKKSAGHVDPDEHEHGLINPAGSERGDLPNLYVNADGTAIAEFFRPGVNLYPSEEAAAANGPYPLMDDDGFAVIIHESPDDHTTQPIGGAGARAACAAIKG